VHLIRASAAVQIYHATTMDGTNQAQILDAIQYSGEIVLSHDFSMEIRNRYYRLQRRSGLRQVVSICFDKHETHGTRVQERTRCYIYTRRNYMYLELSPRPYYRLLGRFLHHYYQRVFFTAQIY